MIIGASGYVGSALALGLRDDFEVFGTYYKSPPLWIEGVHSMKMDCLNGNEILHTVQRYRPDVVIYCAALASSAICEQHPLIADALNSRAPALFFKVLPRAIPFIYVSCDQVFMAPGTDPLFRFTEDDDPNPTNELTTSKTKGEGMVLGHTRMTYVLRVGRIYGERLGSPQRPRENWVQRVLEHGEASTRIAATDDQWRSSVYVGDIVRACRLFLKRAPLSSTIFHLCADDARTEFESARKLLEVWGKDPECVVARSLDALIAEQGVSEPRFSAMSPKRFETLYNFKFQSLDEGLLELRERLETGFTQSWL